MTADPIQLLKKGVEREDVFILIISLGLFALTAYTAMTTLKANKLMIKKLNDEGYK